MAFGFAAILGIAPPNVVASDSTYGVTVEDLVAITRIKSINVSPDGNHVAFLSVKGIPRDDQYEVTLYLQSTADSTQPLILARYVLPPRETIDDSWILLPTVAQYAWSPDSRRLLYTVHTTRGMELRVRNLQGGTDLVVMHEHERIEIAEVAGKGRGWRIKTFDTNKNEGAAASHHLPGDHALLMKDGYFFDACCVTNPKEHPATLIEEWDYEWGAKGALENTKARAVRFVGEPEEFEWDAKSHRLDTKKDLAVSERRKVEASESSEDNAVELIVDLGLEKTTVSVKRDSAVQEIYEENAGLDEECAEEEGERTNLCLSKDGRLAVLLRSSNLLPDELVKIDLITRKVTALFSPNASFAAKTNGMRVRFIPMEEPRGKLFGRLYLPAVHGKDERYPLVFAPYMSSPLFYAGIGDEVPILTLVTNGIAVFAFDARPANYTGPRSANYTGQGGNLGREQARVDDPREAMEWIIRKLSEEGIIDPTRCGVTGLSYGSDIAMYSYWKSKSFRAVAAAAGGVAPMYYLMAGPVAAEREKYRGFPEPNDGAYGFWKTLSAGLNARSALPPLLLQTADGERGLTIENWTRLRRAGAQVEWLEYPNEGHIKVSPANKWWVNERNLDWFRFWLKDEEDADQGKLGQYGRWREMRRNLDIAKSDSEVNDGHSAGLNSRETPH